MAKWEADVQNYLGFPGGIDGTDLLQRGHAQVARFHVEIIEDEVRTLKKDADTFHLQGQQADYYAKRVLIATGLTHLPPDIPGVKECLGKACFFVRTVMPIARKGNGSSSSDETMKRRTMPWLCCFSLRA